MPPSVLAPSGTAKQVTNWLCQGKVRAHWTLTMDTQKKKESSRQIIPLLADDPVVHLQIRQLGDWQDDSAICAPLIRLPCFSSQKAVSRGAIVDALTGRLCLLGAANRPFPLLAALCNEVHKAEQCTAAMYVGGALGATRGTDKTVAMPSIFSLSRISSNCARLLFQPGLGTLAYWMQSGGLYVNKGARFRWNCELLRIGREGRESNRRAIDCWIPLNWKANHPGP